MGRVGRPHPGPRSFEQPNGLGCMLSSFCFALLCSAMRAASSPCSPRFSTTPSNFLSGWALLDGTFTVELVPTRQDHVTSKTMMQVKLKQPRGRWPLSPSLSCNPGLGILIEILREIHFAGQDFLVNPHWILVTEGGLAANHLVDQDAQCPPATTQAMPTGPKN